MRTTQRAQRTQQQFDVAQASQTISFTSTPPPCSPCTPGQQYTVTANGGGSGNAVTFNIDPSSTSGACSIAGATVTFAGGVSGVCIIDAFQAGDCTTQPRRKCSRPSASRSLVGRTAGADRAGAARHRARGQSSQTLRVSPCQGGFYLGSRDEVDLTRRTRDAGAEQIRNAARARCRSPTSLVVEKLRAM